MEKSIGSLYVTTSSFVIYDNDSHITFRFGCVGVDFNKVGVGTELKSVIIFIIYSS